VASFIRRLYSRSTIREHFDDMLSLGYEALIRAADIWIPRSELARSQTDPSYQVPRIPAGDRDTIFRYLGDEGFFLYAQNHLRNNIGLYLQNVGKPFTVPNTERGRFVEVPLSALDQERFAPSPEDLLIEAEESGRRWLPEAMETLTEKERRVVGLYFGLEGPPGLTPTEIGSLMGFSKQRADELKNKALRKIERYIRDKRGDET
jgi:DNA-directed RNA polymerase specialized sigma subunit